jgi:cytoskeletal protein CcmA (bactofilin family)
VLVANIGKSIVFKGELTGDEDIEIDGQIDGRIDLPGNQLTIGAHGRVKAEIAAKAVIVIGHVTGNVTAAERLEVQSSGIVEGDIRSPRLLIQEGAVVNGAIEMTNAGAAKEPTRNTPAPGTGDDAARKTG